MEIISIPITQSLWLLAIKRHFNMETHFGAQMQMRCGNLNNFATFSPCTPVAYMMTMFMSSLEPEQTMGQRVMGKMGQQM